MLVAVELEPPPSPGGVVLGPQATTVANPSHRPRVPSMTQRIDGLGAKTTIVGSIPRPGRDVVVTLFVVRLCGKRRDGMNRVIDRRAVDFALRETCTSEVGRVSFSLDERSRSFS